ncbi:FAD-dependent oxidoreductase [Amycolatopsis sp. lyj-346]|uniref:FAD-dependent oxidoreductase n=1 Tax=Amycolatopsis sp. lyj-346 TaxID=2789289 RepID=UPI00397A2314
MDPRWRIIGKLWRIRSSLPCVGHRIYKIDKCIFVGWSPVRGLVDVLRPDILVVGAGISGLMAAVKLARLGFDVLLAEKGPRLAPASSTRNEGWLHAGTYHANSIPDRRRAHGVAKGCALGFLQIKTLIPEAVGSEPAIALVREENRAAEAEDRWLEFSIPFKRVSVSDFRSRLPLLDHTLIYRAYLVRDAAIDSRILFRFLSAECNRLQVRTILDCDVRLKNGEASRLVVNGVEMEVEPSVTVVAAGPWTGDLLGGLDFTVNVRFWKSHILYGRSLFSQNFFWLDPNECTIINHGETGVIGLNEDSYPVVDLNATVDRSRACSVLEAAARCLPSKVGELESYSSFACIKVDIFRDETRRSLDAEVLEFGGRVFCILPGKLTAAPHACDLLVQKVLNCFDDHRGRFFRPWDSPVE